MPRLTETRAARAPLPASGQSFLWCSEVRGFGCRLTPGARSWIVQVRKPDGSKKRITLGAVGTLPVEGPPDAPGARDLAMAALNAARRGEDSAASMGRVRGGRPSDAARCRTQAGLNRSRRPAAVGKIYPPIDRQGADCQHRHG